MKFLITSLLMMTCVQLGNAQQMSGPPGQGGEPSAASALRTTYIEIARVVYHEDANVYDAGGGAKIYQGLNHTNQSLLSAKQLLKPKQ